MNDSNCEAAIREDLKAFADGEIGSPLRRRTIRRHLAGCAACREELTMLETITRDLKDSENGMEASRLSTPLRDRLLQSVPAIDSVPSEPVDDRPLWRRQPMLIFGGGATLAASAVAFGVLFTGAAQTSPGSAGANGAVTTAQVVSHPGTMMPTTSVRAKSARIGAATLRSIDGVRTASIQRSEPLTSRVADASGRAQAPSGYQAEVYSTSENAKVMSGVVAGGIAPGIGEGAVADRHAASMAVSAAPMSAREPLLADDGRQVHRDASIGLEVAEIEEASDRIEDAVKADGGYVASDNLTTDRDSGEKAAEIIVKVPEKDFAEMMRKISKVGSVVAKNLASEDIADKVGEANDGEQALVDQATELQDEIKAGHLSDRRIMRKEAELRSVHEQLAQTRARLGGLRKMAAMATIDVSLTELRKAKATPVPESPFWSGMHESNRSAMLAFQSAIRLPLLLLTWAVALGPIWVPLLIVFRYYTRKSADRR